MEEKLDMTMMVDKYTYRKLCPDENGVCTQEVINAPYNDRFNALFPFVLGRKMHIFCIYIEDKDIQELKNDSVFAYFNNLWETELNRREEERRANASKARVPDTNRDPDITICVDEANFKETLVADMLYKKCISPKEMKDLQGYLSAPRIEAGKDYFKNPDDVDVALIYFISKDTYESLKRCYYLPRRYSAVISLSENQIMFKNNREQQSETENSEKVLVSRAYLRELEVIYKTMISDYLSSRNIKERQYENDFASLLKDTFYTELYKRFKSMEGESALKDKEVDSRGNEL